MSEWKCGEDIVNGRVVTRILKKTGAFAYEYLLDIDGDERILVEKVWGNGEWAMATLAKFSREDIIKLSGLEKSVNNAFNIEEARNG